MYLFLLSFSIYLFFLFFILIIFFLGGEGGRGGGTNTKNISSHELKISAISLVLRTCEITYIFNTFDEIYLVFISKSEYPLSIFMTLKQKIT